MQAGIISIFKASRWPNLLIMAATQAFCAWQLAPDVAEASLLLLPAFLFTLAGTLLIGAAGYIFNDITDTATDLVNKPEKVIITAGNRRTYIIIYVFISTLGIVAGFLASVYTGLVAFAMDVLLIVYSLRLKKMVLLGNIAVAIMSAMVLLILHFSLPAIDLSFLWIYAGFAFMVSLIREIVKDIEDIEGDRQTGCHTLPVVYGIKTAKQVAHIFTIVLGAGIILFAIKCILSLRIFAFVYLIAAVAIPAFGLWLYIHRAKDKPGFAKASLYCKLLMLAGILSMYFIY